MELKKVTRLAWRKLIDGEYGAEGLLYLKERGPSIKQGEPHEMIFQAGRVEGYKEALRELSNIVVIEEKSNQSLENL